jgi:hypothetical protein
MTRRTLDDWQKLVNQQINSELSVAEFCKLHSLGETYFYKRKSDLKKLDDNTHLSRFIKVNQPKASLVQSVPIQIQYQQTQLCLPVSISPLWLAELIKALS